MKKLTTLFLGLTFALNLIGQEDWENVKDEGPSLPNTMFSVEAGHHFNTYNGKNAFGVKGYVWFLRKNSIGSEFHTYFPTANRKYLDYSVDFALRRIIVDFHPLTFDLYVGPSYRSTLDVYDINDKFIDGQEASKRYWLFDGVNIGFGVNYRFGNHSIYMMPKINHKDANFQVSTGYKFHFDVDPPQVFNNKYKLRKKRRKN